MKYLRQTEKRQMNANLMSMKASVRAKSKELQETTGASEDIHKQMKNRLKYLAQSKEVLNTIIQGDHIKTTLKNQHISSLKQLNVGSINKFNTNMVVRGGGFATYQAIRLNKEKSKPSKN